MLRVYNNSVDFLKKDAVTVARELLGWQFFVRESDGSLTGGVIMETEAYTADDASSHSFNGKTIRNQVMFDDSGYIYVYFTYGMHWCVNIVTGEKDDGQAVLLRALHATHNIELMRERRANKPDSELTNGPAKICQALGITKKDNGQKIDDGRFILIAPDSIGDYKIHATTRIGISKDTHRLWRFVATPDS